VQLVKEFLKPVLIATFMATPVTWYVMNKWLEEFAYRIEISAWVFVLTIVIVLLISILTMSVQSIKAAMSNPVKSLRAE
jgi:putative ABC transport system permease protein